MEQWRSGSACGAVGSGKGLREGGGGCGCEPQAESLYVGCRDSYEPLALHAGVGPCRQHVCRCLTRAGDTRITVHASTAAQGVPQCTLRGVRRAPARARLVEGTSLSHILGTGLTVSPVVPRRKEAI